MEWMISVAQLLLSLSILVAVHEMGHLLAAKYFGMRVEQFSIGFPPKLWSFRKGETEYAISAIPLGGYVKISGMIDESLDTDAMKAEPQPWEFRSKPAWQRLIVMLGGIIVNVIVGIIIFIGITYVYGDTNIRKDEINKRGGFAVGSIGKELGMQSGDKIVKINGEDYKYFEDLIHPKNLLADNASYTVLRDGKEIKLNIKPNFIEHFSELKNGRDFVSPRIPAFVTKVVKDSLAGQMGLAAGDTVIEMNGKPIRYHDEMGEELASFQGDTLKMKVRRGADTVALAHVFIPNKERKLGIATELPEDYWKDAEVVTTYGFVESIPLGTSRAFETLFTQIKAFGRMVTGALNPRKSLSGPIGIAEAFGNKWKWERFWSLTGVLSLVLAFMNLLPIPALDGGHVMFLTYEIVSRRKPSDKFLETAQKIGMVFLLGLILFVITNDIIKKFD
jgi:regulator of sigma E protease